MLADRYEGKRLNRPNDLRAHPDGSLWFSEPDFLFRLRPDEVKELEGQYLFRLDPQSKGLTAVVKDARKPNGLAISEDGKSLFFTDSMSKHIYQAPILDDSAVGSRLILRGASGVRQKSISPMGHCSAVVPFLPIPQRSPFILMAGSAWRHAMLPTWRNFSTRNHRFIYLTNQQNHHGPIH